MNLCPRLFQNYIFIVTGYIKFSFLENTIFPSTSFKEKQTKESVVVRVTNKVFMFSLDMPCVRRKRKVIPLRYSVCSNFKQTTKRTLHANEIFTPQTFEWNILLQSMDISRFSNFVSENYFSSYIIESRGTDMIKLRLNGIKVYAMQCNSSRN